MKGLSLLSTVRGISRRKERTYEKKDFCIGTGINFCGRFGYGIRVAYPPIWLEPLQIARGSDQVMQPGMVFVLHGYLQMLDEGLGVMMGGTYHLGEDGLEMLAGSGDVPLEMY